MNYFPDRPMIVHSDFTIWLETKHPDYEEVRGLLGRFADLLKSPEHVHTYRVTPLSLWNAASSGMSAEDMIGVLEDYGKFAPPKTMLDYVIHYMRRFGLVRLEGSSERLFLVSDEPSVLRTIRGMDGIREALLEPFGEFRLEVRPDRRGAIKQELIRRGYPVQDVAGYHEGERVPIRLKSVTGGGRQLSLRSYQKEALHSFYRDGTMFGGSGVLVLPCGAGKTVIGIAAMAELGCATLVLTTHTTSVRQWREEMLDKTDLTPDMIGEYTGDRKEVRPVTIATYQILTHRRGKDEEFAHMKLFNERDWGLIIYDEVHLLPAPVFRVTADIQATRRLGLTATLVREDGREEDVFSLVGPKRYDVSWKELERDGWISRVDCTELRVPMDTELRTRYLTAESRRQIRIAGENPLKLRVVRRLLEKHRAEPTLVIGQYLDQLRAISAELGAPLVSGEMPHGDRDELYRRFREGSVPLLVVSKVANFAVDLPDAAVAIQVSGSFGSRQEEAQRLGRILRPKRERNRAHFYSLVSKESKEQDFSMNRQLFLVEQGYQYRIEDTEPWLREGGGPQ